MRLHSRALVLATSAVAAAALATPSFAATATKTSLTARAAHTSAKPKSKDTLLLTLRAGKAGVADQKDRFCYESRHTTSTSTSSPRPTKWTSCKSVTATPGKAAGSYSFSVTIPSLKKGLKEQYLVKFKGGSSTSGLPAKTITYAPSHSQIVSVTIS